MELKLTHSFKNKFIAQVEFMAKDKPAAARKFQTELLSALKAIVKEPLRNRKSIYFDSPKIRELVVKGYVIVYEVDLIVEEITVFSYW